MTAISNLLQQIRESNVAEAELQSIGDGSDDYWIEVNLRAIQKRRRDLERRLNTELYATQSDLVQYHVHRPSDDTYSALAVAGVLSGFQELVTAVFDALRYGPKQRYRPNPESLVLSTLELSLAAPTGSIMLALSVQNERLLAVKSDLDHTFEEITKLITVTEADDLRAIAKRIGIASIAKAHDWAENMSTYGLDSRVSIRKDSDQSVEFAISSQAARSLKEAIEEKSDRNQSLEPVFGELVGIDVDRPKTYFHLKAEDGRDIEGKLSESFQTDKEWAVHVRYSAELIKVTTVKYSTGEEKTDWILAGLFPDEPSGPHAQGATSPLS